MLQLGTRRTGCPLHFDHWGHMCPWVCGGVSMYKGMYTCTQVPLSFSPLGIVLTKRFQLPGLLTYNTICTQPLPQQGNGYFCTNSSFQDSTPTIQRPASCKGLRDPMTLPYSKAGCMDRMVSTEGQYLLMRPHAGKLRHQCFSWGPESQAGLMLEGSQDWGGAGCNHMAEEESM
jgi:hypothetical protein